MKYVVTEDEHGIVELYMFPRHINHDWFVECLGALRKGTPQNWDRLYHKPISAGFISSDMKCSGRSESLDLTSRPELDTLLLRKQL